MFSKSRSLGEGTLIIESLKYILNNNLKFDNLFKISGRYFLNDNFDYKKFCNNKVNYSFNNTRFYKITKNEFLSFLYYWINCEESFQKCKANEELFNEFINLCENKIQINLLGLEGYISVDKYHIVE